MGETIYVVDDDPGMRLGLERLLNKCGFKTEAFESAEDFYERADVGRADCLVLDVKLKNKSGIDLRIELAASGVSVPVIFITADDTETTRKAMINAGCFAHLTKPFLGKSLIDVIVKAVDSKRTH